MKRTNTAPKINLSTERLSATIEPEVLRESRQIAKLCGFSFSFSAYVNDVLKRELQHRRTALSNARA